MTVLDKLYEIKDRIQVELKETPFWKFKTRRSIKRRLNAVLVAIELEK